MRGRGHQLLHGRVRTLRRLAAVPVLLVLLVLVVVAFVAWEGFQGRFSTASHASILATIAAVLALALVSGRGRQRKRSRTWVHDAARGLRGVFASGRVRTAAVAGALVWVALIAVTIGWDATSFTKQRHDLPTLSRLFGDVTDHDWGRALVFAAWLVLGLYLAAGWRRPTEGPGSDRGLASPRTGPRPHRSPTDEDVVA